MTLQELAVFNRESFNPFGLAGLARSAANLIELKAKVLAILGTQSNQSSNGDTHNNVTIIALPSQLPAGSPGQSLGRRLGEGMSTAAVEGNREYRAREGVAEGECADESHNKRGPSSGSSGIIETTATAS